MPLRAATANPNDKLVASLESLRDSFVKEVRAAGFQPSLAAPAIALDNPPSYGDYDDSKNVLHIANWNALSPDEQARFGRLAAMLGQGQTGEQAFEDGIHRWVFIHEMGHWWQACEHTSNGAHYAEEYGANRIAAAFWRKMDSGFMDRTRNKMTRVIASLPSPVPEGQAKEVYFNENYQKLAGTPGYIWYQYDMVIHAEDEKPLPSFAQALQQPS